MSSRDAWYGIPPDVQIRQPSSERPHLAALASPMRPEPLWESNEYGSEHELPLPPPVFSGTRLSSATPVPSYYRPTSRCSQASLFASGAPENKPLPTPPAEVERQDWAEARISRRTSLDIISGQHTTKRKVAPQGRRAERRRVHTGNRRTPPESHQCPEYVERFVLPQTEFHRRGDHGRFSAICERLWFRSASRTPPVLDSPPAWNANRQSLILRMSRPISHLPHPDRETMSRLSTNITSSLAPPPSVGIPALNNPLWLQSECARDRAHHRGLSGPEMHREMEKYYDRHQIAVPTALSSSSHGTKWMNYGLDEEAYNKEYGYPILPPNISTPDRYSKYIDNERPSSTSSVSTKLNASKKEDSINYPSGWSLYLLLFGLAMVTFVVSIDNTIIATAIPVIATEFDALGDVGWFGSAYLLTVTSLQPSAGKVYTYFNVKWTYITALCIFECGSVICGAAMNANTLILGRAIAGAGAAGLSSGSLTIIGYAVPPRKRPMFIGLSSGIFGVSAVLGPLLGGIFTDRVSWRWCFLINLPIGAVAIASVFLFFKNPDRNHSKQLTFKQKICEMDLVGALLLVCTISCLLLALAWGGSTYPWRDAHVWGVLAVAGLLAIVFIVCQLRLKDKATLPPRIMSHRVIIGGAIFTGFASVALLTHVYYLPFYFQAVKGVSAEASGIQTIPYLVSNAVAALMIGITITVVGQYVPFAFIGGALFTIGSGLLYSLQVDSPMSHVIGFQILTGMGIGACGQIPFVAVMVSMDPKDLPTANAVIIFFNALGGSIGVSIAQTVFSNTLSSQTMMAASSVDYAKIIATAPSQLRQLLPAALLPGVLKAYNVAVTTTFIPAIACAGICFSASFLFEWKSVKGKMLDVGGA